MTYIIKVDILEHKDEHITTFFLSTDKKEVFVKDILEPVLEIFYIRLSFLKEKDYDLSISLEDFSDSIVLGDDRQIAAIYIEKVSLIPI